MRNHLRELGCFGAFLLGLAVFGFVIRELPFAILIIAAIVVVLPIAMAVTSCFEQDDWSKLKRVLAVLLVGALVFGFIAVTGKLLGIKPSIPRWDDEREYRIR